MQDRIYSYQNSTDPSGAEASSDALSVSAAMAAAKHALEQVTVRILGEVSEVSAKAGYKACYFTVKDRDASLPCMMWNNRYQASGVKLQVGMMVEITGRFSLYAAKGRMNFDVFSINVAGEGRLRMMVAELAKKLEREGLTSPEIKRALPLYPQNIGLVTSPRGAAVHDVLRTLRRLWPMARVSLAGVPVEGAGAAAGIVRGIQTLDEAGVDVILVVRGGGSFEDLMPFNDEALARAIRATKTPVVTGIGHEPDTSIADMVADRRASTPTAAAETVASDAAMLSEQIAAKFDRMTATLKSRLDRSGLVLERYTMLPFFREPERLFDAEMLALDDLSDRLHSALPKTLEADGRRLSEARMRLTHIGDTLLLPAERAVRLDAERCRGLGERMTERFRGDLALKAARLHDLSPLQVLSRGYGIVRDESGRIVSSADAVSVGEHIDITVSDGVIGCAVLSSSRQQNKE